MCTADFYTKTLFSGITMLKLNGEQGGNEDEGKSLQHEGNADNFGDRTCGRFFLQILAHEGSAGEISAIKPMKGDAPESFGPRRECFYTFAKECYTCAMAYDFSALDTHIKETGEWLTREFSGIRTGRASPALLDAVRVNVYGARTPLSQMGSVSIEDARTLRVVPWDKDFLKEAEKAIIDEDLGVSVSADDLGLRVFFPELTAERRTMLLKLANDRMEQARITLRGHRTDALKLLESSEKEGGMGKDEIFRLKEEIQKKIDAGTAALDALMKKKHDEISL
jgi:ribosome recycling factor